MHFDFVKCVRVHFPKVAELGLVGQYSGRKIAEVDVVAIVKLSCIKPIVHVAFSFSCKSN